MEDKLLNDREKIVVTEIGFLLERLKERLSSLHAL